MNNILVPTVPDMVFRVAMSYRWMDTRAPQPQMLPRQLNLSPSFSRMFIPSRRQCRIRLATGVTRVNFPGE